MKLIEMIEVMLHYDKGGEIIYRLNSDGCSSWSNCPNPLWDWIKFEYKIKKEKQKVTIEKWLMKDVDSDKHFILEASDVDLTLKDFPKWKKVKLIESYEIEL